MNLVKTIELVNSVRQEEKIKFAFVVGDISYSYAIIFHIRANTYQFEKFQSIMSNLNVKWFPLIGDHDVLQFNKSWEERQATSDTLFYRKFRDNFEKLKRSNGVEMMLQQEDVWNKLNGMYSKFHNFE